MNPDDTWSFFVIGFRRIINIQLKRPPGEIILNILLNCDFIQEAVNNLFTLILSPCFVQEKNQEDNTFFHRWRFFEDLENSPQI